MERLSVVQLGGLIFTLVVILLVTYRALQNISTGRLQTNETDSSRDSPPMRMLQCSLKPSTRTFNSQEEHTLPDLRLRNNESGLFPFPKSYSSSESATPTNLVLSGDFRIHFMDDIAQVRARDDIKAIFNRFCSETNAAYHSHGPQTALISDVVITFSDAHILATSSDMWWLLAARSSEAQQNAAYIDAEMYSLRVGTDGRAHIAVHSPSLFEGAHRGLANAFASLEQLVHQAIPVQLPLLIVDWPDNHWRGELRSVTICL